MIFAVVLLCLLAVSVLYNLGNFARSMFHVPGTGRYYVSRTAGPRLEEVIREDNAAANKIAVIELNGIIIGDAFDQGGFGMVDVIKAQLKRAQEDDRVKAVVLKVDSPGGEVLASDDIYRAIAAFQQDSLKPVVVSMGSVAASGGYYVSSASRWIVANELTITGSIGVIMSSWNYRGLMDKVGVVPQTYKSGKFKDMLSGSRKLTDITDEEREMLMGLILQTYGRFTNVVQAGRQKAFEKSKGADKARELNSKWPDYADGRVLSGAEAFKLGFVDELGGFNDAVARAQKLAGISRANLIEYQQRYDFSDFLRLFGKSESRALKIELDMESPKLKAGQLYFLAPTFVH